jgi:hypothetical protein
MLLRADLHPFRPNLIFAHVFNDHAEVSPVSRRVMFQPLSEPLQPGIRFLYGRSEVVAIFMVFFSTTRKNNVSIEKRIIFHLQMHSFAP